MYLVAANWKGKTGERTSNEWGEGEEGGYTFNLITPVRKEYTTGEQTHTEHRGFFSRGEIELISLPPPLLRKTYTTSVVVWNRHGQRLASPRNKIMVIDYPTWKPPSGISITYVCIPTGNLPLIRSNSEVTQFTPASNLKWDCLMAQGTSKWAFPTSQGTRGPFRYPAYTSLTPTIIRLRLLLFPLFGGRVSTRKGGNDFQGFPWDSSTRSSRFHETLCFITDPRKSSPHDTFPRGNGQIGIVVNAPENSTWVLRGHSLCVHPNPLWWNDIVESSDNRLELDPWIE